MNPLFQKLSRVNKVHFLCVVVLVALFFLRSPSTFTNPGFWGEDAEFFHDAHNHPVENLIHRYGGYFLLLPQTITLFAQLLPLENVPFFMVIVPFLSQCLPIFYLLSSRLEPLLPNFKGRLLIATMYVLFPATIELYGNVTAMHWYTWFTVFLILLSRPSPSSWIQNLERVFLFFFSLTGPLVVFVLIGYLYYSLRTQKTKWIEGAILAAGSMVQIISILNTSGRVKGEGSFDWIHSLKSVGALGVYNGLFGIHGTSQLPEALFHPALLLSLGLIFLIALASPFLLRQRAELQYLSLIGFALIVAPLLIHVRFQLDYTYHMHRYFVIPNMAITIFAIYGLKQIVHNKAYALWCIPLLVMGTNGVVNDFHINKLQDKQWNKQVIRYHRAYLGETVIIPTNPEGWESHLVKKESVSQKLWCDTQHWFHCRWLQQLQDWIKGPRVQWYMVNVNSHQQQGDAHVIITPSGSTILIDTGTEEEARHQLVPFLKDHQINTIDYVFVSHPHKDHYGGLMELVRADIQLQHIYFNLPDQGVCDAEIPWGCDYPHILETHQWLQQQDIPMSSAKAGDSWTLGEVNLSILYAFDGVNTPVGRTDVNDLSLIMKLTHGKNSILFTGDLNLSIGNYLAKHGVGLESTFLKVPHHGVESLAPNSFFEVVNPKHAMVPGTQELWCSFRSHRIRQWFDTNQVPTWVNGLSGHIEVELKHDDYHITEQYHDDCGIRRELRFADPSSTKNLKQHGSVDQVSCHEQEVRITGWVPYDSFKTQTLIVKSANTFEPIAVHNIPRPDVAKALGHQKFLDSGFMIQLKTQKPCDSLASICLMSETTGEDGATRQAFVSPTEICHKN